MNCNTSFQKKLNRINLEIDLERSMAIASLIMTVDELFADSRLKGDGYHSGFQDGFWKAHELFSTYLHEEKESIVKKHSCLM
jgi:hypothetical protein